MIAHSYSVVLGTNKSLTSFSYSNLFRRIQYAMVALLLTTLSHLVYGQCPSFTISPPTGQITCNGSSVTFTASGGSNYRWYKDAPLVPTNLQTSGVSSYTPTASGSYYLVGDACGLENQVRPFSIVISTTPAAPSMPGITIPYGSSTLLRPTTVLSSGESFKWYASNQTSLLGQGAEFYTGSLTSNTTYYVSKSNGYCEGGKTGFTVSMNALPTASAGSDVNITLPLSSRNITGSGSDGGNPVTYQWSKISGPSITMSGTTTTTLVLTNISAGIYVFRLAVTDNIGQTVVDDMVFQAAPASATNNYNYTRQETMLVSGITSQASAGSLVVGQKSSKTLYTDELGRPMEAIGWQSSPGKFDAISPVVYDNLGREGRSYLPEISSGTGDGLYKKVLDGSGEYSGSIQNLYGSNKPYSITVFENSPLSRAVEQGSAGLSWQPGSTSGTTKVIYGANASGEVRIWTINSSTGLPQSSATWAAATLTSQTSTNYVSDTKQSVAQVFSDGQGLKVVERMKVDASNWAETHYVYDTRNNLRFIITPELYKDLKASGNYTPTSDQVNRYCFQYMYDDQHRLIGSKAPGVDWEYSVYDVKGRLVLTQNGNQRIKNEWSYIEYDAYDRQTVMGIYRPSSSNWTRGYFQSVYDGTVSLPASTSTVLTGTTIVRNTKGSYEEYIASSSITLQPGFTASAPFKAWIYSLLQPGQVLTSGTTEPLVYTYYDTYSGNSFFQDANFAFENQTWDSPPVTDPLYVPETYTSFFDRVRGQITGGSVKVLGSEQWLHTVIYYDEKQRAIQTVSSVPVGGVSRSSTLYDFSGKVLQSKQSQLGQTTVRLMKYDHAGRLLKVYHKLNSQPQVILSSFEYDQLGRLIDKKLYSGDVTSGSPGYLQSIDYGYNIKGWLTKANSASGSDAGETDYFGYEMGYETDAFGAGIGSNLRKDGAATAIKWRNNLTTRQNLYTYDYDNLTRLNGAVFKSGINSAWSNKVDFYSEKGLSYDYNGNIQALQRNKQSSVSLYETIDNLSYNYGSSKGNQLMKVTENSSSGLKDLGFKDGVNTAEDDYGYDVNGNLLMDKNKGIVSIAYNFQNLPERVTFSDGTYMQYVYTASGVKIRQTYFNGGGQSQIKTDYLGDQLLVNDLPVVIFHEEGRLLPPDNTNLILNRDAGSKEGYTENLSVSLTPVLQNGQNYIKVVSNQATGNPGVFISMSPSYTVKPGERYQFKVLGYRETTQHARLYVKHGSGDIISSTGALLPQGVSNETWSTNEFVVPSGVTQITLGVRWDNPVNGSELYINQVALYKMDWEYQYFLEDQVGSPRVVLSTNPSTHRYTATFETENQSTEATQFFNINPGKISIHTSNVTPGGNEALWMNNTYRIGPNRSLKVYPGDQIDASVSAYYTAMSGLTQATTSVMVNALITTMLGGAGIVPVVDGGITTAYNNSDLGAAGFSLSPNNGTTRPSAFLNYILFDENYVPLEAKSVPVGSTAGVNQLLSFSTAFGSAVSVKELGYMFVYLSYDNENTTPVYFDDFKIVHTESPVVQVNDNYPFGLTAYSWIREGEYENRFLYQGKELDSKTGWQDFHARQYDATLGRWFAVDPEGQFASPYTGMGNNPVIGVDPDGKFWNIIIGAVVGGVSNYITGRHAGLRGDDLFFHTVSGAMIGAISGGVASGVTAGTSAALGSAGSSLAGGAASGAFSGAATAALSGQNVGQGGFYGMLGGLAGSTAGLANVKGIIPGALYGAATGGVLSGGIAAATGGEFFDGFGTGAISGGILGGIQGGAMAAQSHYDRNILFGGYTRTGKQNFLNDLAIASGAYEKGLNNIILGRHSNFKRGENAVTNAILNGHEISFSEYTRLLPGAGTKANVYMRPASLQQMASTFGHEMVHVTDIYSGYGKIVAMNLRIRYAQPFGGVNWDAYSKHMKGHFEYRAYQSNIMNGYNVDAYRNELAKWSNYASF